MLAVHNFLNENDLAKLFATLDPAQPIALALSGGGDSMGLLHLLIKWRGAKNIYALTVDHSLRDGSAAEAAQVKAWCTALNIKHHTLTWSHEPIKTGIQAKARKARYELMTKWCLENKVPTLFTAHTIEDQVETVAMRTLRTKSPQSLAGIWPEQDWNGIKICRPLLKMSGKDLRLFLQSIRQTWLEDPSNKNLRFERVRMRAQRPDLELATLATNYQTEVRQHQEEAARWLSANFSRTAQGTGTLNFETFPLLNLEAKDIAIAQIIKHCGGTVPERAKRNRLGDWIIKFTSRRTTCGKLIFTRRKNEIAINLEPGRRLSSASTIQK